MDWETDRRTYDPGVLRASEQHGLRFGPEALRRLDALDARIGSATADVTRLRSELRLPDGCIAAELNLERLLQQVVPTPPKEASGFTVGQRVRKRDVGGALTYGYVTHLEPLRVTFADKPYEAGSLESVDGTYTWDEVTEHKPTALVTAEQASRSTAWPAAEQEPEVLGLAACVKLSDYKAMSSPVREDPLRPTLRYRGHDGKDAAGSQDEAKVSSERFRTRLEPHRLKRGDWLATHTFSGRARLQPKGARTERIEVTWPPLPRFPQLPNSKQGLRTDVDAEVSTAGSRAPIPPDSEASWDDFPPFLRSHPSRLVGPLRAGFRSSSVRRAPVGAVAGFGPPPVVRTSEDTFPSESLSLQCVRAPTELEWETYYDRELVSNLLLGHTARKLKDEGL